MTKKLASFAVLALALVAGACGKSKNPVSPDPIPDQSKYEALPALHYLVDENDNRTKMWARLSRVNPLRGGFITLGIPCSPNCFQVGMELGVDPLPNPHAGPRFQVWLGQTENDTSRPFWDCSAGADRPCLIGNDPSIWYPLNVVPKFLVIRGSYNGDFNGTYGSFPGEAGASSFLLDYQAK